MKVTQQHGHGLLLTIETGIEWMLLRSITRDAQGNLARDLGELMGEDDMWEEFIVPELENYFLDQREQVQRIIVDAFQQAQEGDGEIHISRNEADLWYAVLNQAQLELEKQHCFGQLENVDEDELEGSKAQAYARRRFYGFLQQLLLDHVME